MNQKEREALITRLTEKIEKLSRDKLETLSAYLDKLETEYAETN